MSRKTQTAKKARTGSGHNKASARLVGLAFVAVLACFALYPLLKQQIASRYCIDSLMTKADIIRCRFNIEYATTTYQWERGLSYRKDLPKYGGMLFDFDSSAKQCMWMKDMLFSLDMVWLDKHKRILRILKDVSPQTYPETFCTDNTRYVLELKAGTADFLGLNVGDSIQL